MVTELRVHGVSGTPAERMLDRPLLCPVAGDSDAGFLRPHPAYPAEPGPGGARLEAYRWGGLTAGAATRALWLMLLPFMLANVAMWLRPKTGDAAANVLRALSRIFALTVTATFVLSITGVAVDLVGWQCATPGNRCVEDRFYLTFLTELSVGQRLAVTSLLPMAALMVLWYLARRTWTRYEGYPAAPTGVGDGLSHPCFWNGKPQVGRLRALHLATGFAVVDAVLLGVLVPHERDAWGYALAGGTAVVLFACVLLLCLTSFVHRDTPGRWARGAAVVCRSLALLLTIGTLGYAAAPHDALPTGGALPGYGMTVTVLFAAQAALLVLIGLVSLGVRAKGAPLFGLAGPVVGSLALGVAVAFSAGLSYRVADFLDRDSKPSPADFGAQAASASTLDPPASYEWAALGFVLLVLVLVAVVLIGRLSVVRRLRRAATAVTDADFPGRRAEDPQRAGVVDSAIARARLADHIGPLLAWAYVPLGLAAAVVTGLALAGVRPVRIGDPDSPLSRVLSSTVSVGAYLIGLSVLGLLVLGVLAYRYEGVRRIVGVAWDLGTFWPRAAHPLAPPCYAERAVPELVTRTTFLARDGGVVLSGHSQGSVLAAATVLQLPESVRDGVALVTYGSPLGRLYARYFPSFVDPTVLGRIGPWVNVWRDTDPIGGRVGAAAEDVRLVDPAGFHTPPGDTIHPPVAGHSGYQATPEFASVVAGLVVGVAQSGTDGVSAVVGRAAVPGPAGEPVARTP